MGHRLLHQSHTAGGVGPLPARGPDRDARARGKKIALECPNPARGSSGSPWKLCYTQKFGAVPKWPKGEVCKTSIRGFESHPRLQAFLVLPGELGNGTYRLHWQQLRAERVLAW